MQKKKLVDAKKSWLNAKQWMHGGRELVRLV